MPKFGLGPDFLLRGQEDELIKNYKKYMIDIAVLLGAKREYADKELTESLDFEIKLVNVRNILWNKSLSYLIVNTII